MANAGRIENMERAAKKACLTGDPSRGVSILADLYIDTDDPTYLYNQGRCFEQNSRYEDAITKFREYLRKSSKASAAEKADAEKHIADCEKLLGKKSDGPATVAIPETPRPATVVAPEPVPTPKPAPETVPPAVAVSSTVAAVPPETPTVEITKPALPVGTGEGRGLRIGGIVTASAGAAVLVGGLLANLKHNSMIDDLQGGYEPGKHDSAKTYRTLAIAGYGAGTASLAAGAVLYYLGWRAGNVSVAPVATAGSAGAVMTGAF